MGPIRRAALLAALGLSPGCRSEAPPAEPAPAAAESVAAEPAAAAPAAAPTAPDRTPIGQPPTHVPGTAAPLRAKAPDPAEKARLDSMRGLMRGQFFEAQSSVPLLAGGPAHARALVPADAKLVEVELYRRMRLLKPQPGARRLVLRWLTPLRGAALEAQVKAAVAAWAGDAARPTPPVTHPERGTLTWTISSPPERPSRVEMVLDDADPEGPLPPPSTLLTTEAPWIAALGDTPLVGFEAGRYHARRGGARSTDVERYAATVQTADAPTLQKRFEEALIAAGYKADDDDPRVLRGPGRATFTTRRSEGRLTLHHQRRWSRPAAAAER